MTAESMEQDWDWLSPASYSSSRDQRTIGRSVITSPILSASILMADGALLIGISLLTSRLFEASISTHDLVTASFCGMLTFFARGRGQENLRSMPLRDLRSRFRVLALDLLCAALVFSVILLLLAQPARDVARVSISWFAFGVGLLGTQRLFLSLTFGNERVAAKLVRHVAVIGSTASASRIESLLSVSPGIRLVGRFDDEARAMAAGVAFDGSIGDLVSLGRHDRLDAIVVALPYERRAEMKSLCLRLRTILADVYVVPYLLEGYDMILPEIRLGSCILSVAQRRPLDDWQSLQKAIFDRTMAAILLAVFSPILFALALVIKFDSPGPAIFRQTRLGLNNHPFTVFKFRTMYTKDSDLLADRQTSRCDPRVTAPGRWLRRLSLDELPQLINVVRGDMSLVGPRPHAPHTRAGGKLLDDALGEYVIRHQVKPGITGWAQVNGARGELVTVDQLRRRLMFDLDYMRRWSLLFDLRILVLTVTREIFSRHAY